MIFCIRAFPTGGGLHKHTVKTACLFVFTASHTGLHVAQAMADAVLQGGPLAHLKMQVFEEVIVVAVVVVLLLYFYTCPFILVYIQYFKMYRTCA